jgi:exodeoxyribonuclease V alpha subunit
MDLVELRAAGFFELLDVELARALARAAGSPGPELELAIALTSRNVRRGHTCFSLQTKASDLWPPEAAPALSLPAQSHWEAVLRQSTLTRRGPLVLDERSRLYFRRYFELERDVAGELATRSAPRREGAPDPAWLEGALRRLFGGDAVSPQRKAATNAMRHRLSLLCGGPGTGKTTAVAAIVALLIERDLRAAGHPPHVMLLAPTGKSAARLGEAVTRAKLGIDASRQVLDAIPGHATTVHRALGMHRAGMLFRRDAEHPLEAGVIVVDEASMIDLALMRQLLIATPQDATLLIVGDPDQLTSVEAGSVLRDLVMASTETWWTDRVTHLTTTFRYAEDQPLGQLVRAIRCGDAARVEALLGLPDAEDVAWVGPEGLAGELDRAAQRWAQTLCTTDPEAHFAERSRFVVLSPYRVGLTGTRQLGAAIESRLPKTIGRSAGITPIIIEQNSQELQVYNGDFAMLFQTEPRRAVIQRVAEDIHEVSEARLPPYSNAFALSVHKAQGSEFEEVLIVLPEQDAPLLTRELLYTAVSRAKKRVRLVGPKEVILAALERRAQRYSGLVDAIAASRVPPSGDRPTIQGQ